MKVNEEKEEMIAGSKMQQDTCRREDPVEIQDEQHERLREQLKFANALHRLAEAIITYDDTSAILETMAAIAGETLGVDRSLIYDMDFEKYLLIALCEWLNPEVPEISATKDTYSMDVFANGTKLMREQRCWQESHIDDVNPVLFGDGSANFLHNLMSIKSGLWYPFSFRKEGYYCLVFNQVGHRRVWREVELNFINSVAKQVEIAIQKINFLKDRMLAEKRLKEQLYFLQRLIDTIPNPVFYKNTKGLFEGCNAAYEQYIGLTKEEIVGKSVFEVYPDDLAKVYFEKDSTIFNEPGVQVYETSFRVADGSRRDIVFNKATYTNLDGTPAGLVGVIVDINDRKQANEELCRALAESLQREAEITAIFSAAQVILKHGQFEVAARLIFDACKSTLGAATGYVRLLDGMSSEKDFEFIDMGGSSCDVDPLQPVLIRGLRKRALHTNRPVFHNDFMNSVWVSILPPGHVQLENLMLIPFRLDGRAVGLMGFANKPGGFNENDTRLATTFGELMSVALNNGRALQSLKASEERFSKVFHGSPSMMSIALLADGRFIDVNESWMQYTGYQREEVIGCTANELNLWLDRRILAKALSHKESIRNHELVYRTKNGEVRVGLLSTERIGIGGEPCLLCVFNDITERRLLEKKMARLDQLHLIGEMAASIAHEIRNPMTTVRGFLQILSGKADCDRYKDYYSLMIEELDRANSIISEFLSLARNKVVDKKRVSLNAILESLWPLIQADAAKSDKYVNLDLEKTPDLLLNDKDIRQIVLNLARNGLEAMPANGVLTIRTFTEGEQVVLAVEDQGGGISPDALEKLGTPFFTTKEKGTGLGLAVCYSIADCHKASIKVETSPQGTTFFVRFGMEG